MERNIKLYSKSKVLDLLYAGILFSLILNSSLIFKFNLYSLIGSICATIFCMFFYSFQVTIKEKINIVSVNSVFYSFLLVISAFLYTYNDMSNSIMFSFSATTMGISLVFNFILKEKWKKTANEKN